MEINDKSHSSLLYTDMIQELCRPLFDNTGIKCFAHCMLMETQELTGLTSNSAFTEFCIKNRYYCFPAALLNNATASTYLFSDFMQTDGKVKQMQKAMNKFGYDHFFTIIKVANGIKESFHFAGAVNDDLTQFYMQHQDSLENFILYYKDRVQSNPLLRKVFSEANCIEVKDMQHYTNFHMEPSPIFHAHAEKYVLNINQASLSKREIECLYWLTHGKILEEVATIMHISRRTVKAHIENVKQKLHCDTLFQLGEAYHRLALWRLLQEPLTQITRDTP